ncbi:alpha/beta hydrolase family protein [Krasilnikovia cinnamomea]|uniref:Alpha/beta hydrolase family protein n=1 Tax=Krasilnikovia cinnamomea TaxID=349313 RepID=A0A4Q7ZMX9_9ACTN|nr:alpha/beta hydrolase [Krasilnikovia cinnamomea]RZU52001.1 alpha/beta hydrolase family protein [Krasilnikovia cinnamomea]
MSSSAFARLRATDPARWVDASHGWRSRAGAAGLWSAELQQHGARLASRWTGAAALAALARLTRLRRGLEVFRLACYRADQALSEFAGALTRARALLATALAAARRAGTSFDDEGNLRDGPTAQAAATEAATALAAALSLATTADGVAARRLAELSAAIGPLIDARSGRTGEGWLAAPPPSAGASPPSCTASPAEVRAWWEALTPAQRLWSAATEPSAIATLDGLPAADRDLANRLLLEQQRAELDRALAKAHGGERKRLHELRDGLATLTDRLADDAGPRAYLLRLDLAGEGRVVVALGDPDRADHVLTHVPGMTAGLASYDGELRHAERVAAQAGRVAPAAATSAVLWLDYDAPDFVDEAAGTGRAEAGAARLRRFQDGLDAAHEGGRAHRTVLGHSYGSLVVGRAAVAPELAADDVIFVGSPGVGVNSAGALSVPTGHVWSSTSRSDIIQYAALAPRGLAADLAVTATVPGLGAVLAFGRPEDDLWFGRNPSDPAFGARVFASQPDAGHLGYWDRGRPALDAITNITVGRDVTPR